MKKRLLYLALALGAAPLLWGQSQVVCTTSSPGTVIAACGGGGASDPLSLGNIVGSTSVCGGGAVDAANSVCVSASAITGEGSSADGNEAVLAFGNASADNTLTLLATASGVELNATTGALLTAAGTGTGRVSVGGVLCKGTGSAPASTSEEILATCTIPANTLTANGASLLVEFLGHTAANANNKRYRIRIGGIAGAIVYDSGAVAANNLNISQLGRVWRLSATAATSRFVGWMFSDAAPSTITGNLHSALRSVAVTWANANDLVITKESGTAASDGLLDIYTVEVVQ